MEPEYQVITKEITAKGKGYIVISSCAPEQLGGVIRRASAELLGQGASLIYAASTDPDAPLAETPGEGYRLRYVHEMLGLERGLTAPERPKPQGLLTLQPLTRERGGAWLAIYNECFFDVPNSVTYDRVDLEQILKSDYRCGFACRDGVPVGVYELGFKKENPEIGSIGLLKDVRGVGLGRELLLAAMDLAAGLGYAKCWLQVSTANTGAYALYQDVGFTLDRVLARWYQVISEGDLMT